MLFEDKNGFIALVNSRGFLECVGQSSSWSGDMSQVGLAGICHRCSAKRFTTNAVM